MEGREKCGNCGEWIPGTRMQLHSAYCERHNTNCTLCRRTIRRAAMESHWHCLQCTDPPFVANSLAARR